MSNELVFGRTDQDPTRVIAAVRGPHGQMLAAVTVTVKGRLKPRAVDMVQRKCETFGVTMPKNIEGLASSAELFTTNPSGKSRVTMHMCSEGMDSCHRVYLNRIDSGNSDLYVHTERPDEVQASLETWACNGRLKEQEKFWFIASGMSRYGELCTDPTLDGYKTRRSYIYI